MGAETWAFSKEFRQSEITLAVTKGRTASWMSIFSDSMFVLNLECCNINEKCKGKNYSYSLYYTLFCHV